MQRYDTYKDSGVKWLGEIPSHWEVIKSKYLWKESFSISENGNEELLSVSQYDGITPAKRDSRSESLKGYKIVSENDLVINIMLAWMGGLGVSKYDGIVSPAYCVYKLTNDSNPKYLHYLYKTPLYLAEFARHSSGVIPSRWRMYTDDFGQVVSLLPPRKEQDAIVEYLDKKMAKIDAAIAQQQKMIDLLNERKQIIINRAVTRGLNPNARMKDSGVEWIGEVPEGWEVRRIKYILKESNIRSIDGHESSYSLSKSKGLIPFTDKDNLTQARINNVGAKVVKPGEIVFNRFKARLFAVSNVEAAVSPDYAIYQKIAECDLQYLVYLFSTKLYRGEFDRIAQGVGDGFSRLYTEDLFSIYAIFPNESEQKQIVGFIRKNTEKIDLAISQCENQISLLQERKQIIINDVVTGKIRIL